MKQQRQAEQKDGKTSDGPEHLPPDMLKASYIPECLFHESIHFLFGLSQFELSLCSLQPKASRQAYLFEPRHCAGCWHRVSRLDRGYEIEGMSLQIKEANKGLRSS